MKVSDNNTEILIGIIEANRNNISPRAETELKPYAFDALVNNHQWKELMKDACGYAPQYADKSIIGDYTVVEQMTSYPEDGLILVTDDCVVIKFY